MMSTLKPVKSIFRNMTYKFQSLATSGCSRVTTSRRQRDWKVLTCQWLHDTTSKITGSLCKPNRANNLHHCIRKFNYIQPLGQTMMLKYLLLLEPELIFQTFIKGQFLPSWNIAYCVKLPRVCALSTLRLVSTSSQNVRHCYGCHEPAKPDAFYQRGSESFM